MRKSRVDELRDLALSMFSANIAVLLCMVRLGVVDRTKMIGELRGILAQVESVGKQELYTFCLNQIISAIESDQPTSALTVAQCG
jgi:hypothetical protein